MYEGGRRSNGGVAAGCRTTARDAGVRAPLHPPARRLAQQAAQPTEGGSGQPPAAGAVLTVRRQAQDALAQLERRRAPTSTTPLAAGDGSRARSREAATAATAGEGPQVKIALAASASSVGSATTKVSATSSAAVGLMGAQGLTSPPPPTGPASLLYAKLSSSVPSSSLNLDELTLAVAPVAQQQSFDDEDPMSPQSVFPRVRQKLREEASSLSGTGAGGGTSCAAGSGCTASSGSAAAGSNIDAADQNADYVPLSSPVAAAAAAAATATTTSATKKRTGRQLPEIPQSVRCRTPPLVALSASADSANRLSFPYDDDGCSVHELSGGGGGGSSSNGGGTPRSQISLGQGAGAGLPLFHRTAPAAVCAVAPAPAGGSNSYGCSSSGSSLVLGASVAAAAASAAAGASSCNSGGLSVITPLPPWAIQKSSLYELRAAFQELSRALAQMEVAAGKRARVRSEAYIIKFEHEFADLARVKDRAVKRLEALLRAGPGGTPAFAPDSAHAQALGAVLRAVLDIDDELLLLMGTEHGTWEELKRVRGDMQRHLLLLGQELRDAGDMATADAVGVGAADPFGPVPMFRSLSSPVCASGSGARGGSSSVFSFAPAAVAASVSSSSCSASTAAAASLSSGGSSSSSNNSKRKAGGRRGLGHGVREQRSGSPTEEDVFKLRPLEASLSSLGSSASSSGGGVNGCGPLSGATSSAGSAGKEERVTQEQSNQPQQQQRRRRPVQLQPSLHLNLQPQQAQEPAAGGDGAQGRDPESPGTMTTASLSSSTSSAFSQLSECPSDEERSVSGGSAFKQPQLSASAAAAAASSSSARLPAKPMTNMSKSISSDALSGLLLNPFLPAALTAKVREKASFLHHRTLGNNKPLLEAAAALSGSGATKGTGGTSATRPRYHTTVSAAGGLGAGRAVPPAAVVEAVAKS